MGGNPDGAWEDEFKQTGHIVYGRSAKAWHGVKHEKFLVTNKFPGEGLLS